MTNRKAVRRFIPAIVTLSLAVFATAAQAYDTFALTGSLTTARGGAMTTVLKNGKVLIAGGASDVSLGSLATAELFDPATGKFVPTGSLSTARFHATSTLLANGKVLVVGGYDDTNRLASAELYDPTTKVWTRTAGDLVTARDWATATRLKNGQVLIAGGYDGARRLASAELYDPTTDRFTTTGNLHLERERPTATLLPSGKVLIAGGKYDRSNASASAEIYDPATGVFTTTGSLHKVRYVASATLLSSGKVLIAGGFSETGGLTSAELYTPSTGTFANTGSLTTARYNATSTLLRNGKVLIAGGYTGSGGWATVETYNPVKGTFTQNYEHYDGISGVFTTRGGLVAARFSASSALLANGKVLVVGGYDEGLALASAELYNPTPPAPGKPTVKWAANKRKRSVTATVNLVSGTTYKLTAKLGRKTKTGRCKTRGSKVTCTLSPGGGKWVFSITPRNAGGDGTANAKAVKL
ncbi:MAG: kelch repeat-containing protein [Actinomycetes bacterium]